MSPLLDIQDLHIAFGDHAVVKGVNLQLAAGEKLALVGESGSGKTLTALSLLGLIPDARVSGSAMLAGTDLLALRGEAQRAVRGADVAMVFQEPMTALNPLMTIGQQIAEVIELKKALPPDEAMLSAIDLLASTGLPEPAQKARAYPHQLSGGQRQRVVIAMALAASPKVLLADEPTTALDVSLRGQILDLLADKQRESGMAVLLITHDLQLVRRFADRIAVMEKGVLVEQGRVADVFATPQHPYTRKLLDSRPLRDVGGDGVAGADGAHALSLAAEVALRARHLPVAAPGAATMPTVQVASAIDTADAATSTAPPTAMSVHDLGVSYPVPLPGMRGWFKRGRFVALQGVHFELPAGRTLGVVGESGSGKSTLALAALNLVAFSGHVEVAGQAWSKQAQANRRQRRRVQVVFQDPFSSLSPRMTVEQIVGEGLLVHAPHLSEAQRQHKVLDALTSVGLLAGADASALQWINRYPHEFSGGQRQRLAIARALVVEPDVIVLDEPTSALDVTVQKQVLTLLQRLQRERGLSYLLITHDMDVIRAMAHEVCVLKNGQVVEAGPWERVLGAPQHPYTQTLVAASLS